MARRSRKQGGFPTLADARAQVPKGGLLDPKLRRGMGNVPGLSSGRKSGHMMPAGRALAPGVWQEISR